MIEREHFLMIGTWAESYNSARGGKLLFYRCCGEETSLLDCADTGKSVSMMTADRERRLLFAACETNYHEENMPGGELQVYRIEENQSLRLLGRYNSYGGFPVGLALTDKYILVLNHGSSLVRACVTYRDETGRIVTGFTSDEASLCLFQRTGDGQIGELADQHIFRGCGEVPLFQDSPAPHDLYASEESGLYFVPARGTDETDVFRINEEAGRIEKAGRLRQRKGTGPRNVACSDLAKERPGDGYAYVVSEIEPIVTVFQNGREGWRQIQELPTTEHLPEELPVTSFSYPHPSGILLNSRKRKLYTITRQANVVTVFGVLPDGRLEKLREVPLEGENPRQMVLSRDSLFVVCMDTGNVLALALDAEGVPVRSREIVRGIERIAYIKLL